MTRQVTDAHGCFMHCVHWKEEKAQGESWNFLALSAPLTCKHHSFYYLPLCIWGDPCKIRIYDRPVCMVPFLQLSDFFWFSLICKVHDHSIQLRWYLQWTSLHRLYSVLCGSNSVALSLRLLLCTLCLLPCRCSACREGWASVATCLLCTRE